MLYFFAARSIFLVYLDEVKCASEANRGLVILDWYFSAGMETTSTKKKGNERKGC